MMLRALQAVLVLIAALAAGSLFYLFGNVAELVRAHERLSFLLLLGLELCAIITLIGVYRIWHWAAAGLVMVLSALALALVVLVYIGAAFHAKLMIPLCLLLLVATAFPLRDRFR